MPEFGKISVTGPANRDVYFRGIYDVEATRLDGNGESENDITAPLGEHVLVTIRDRDTLAIDHEGSGVIGRDGERIVIALKPVA